MDRANLKKDHSEKEKSGNDDSGKEHFEQMTNMNRNNLKKDRSEKETFGKRQF